MSRWEDSRTKFDAARENLQMAQENQELEKRECPFCGESFGQLPNHLRYCDE